MSIQQALPVIDLSKAQSQVNISKLQRGFRKWGAFRLVAPGIQNAFARGVPHGRNFFLLPNERKNRTKGYRPFEVVRGKTTMRKESLYFFRKSDQDAASLDPPSGLSMSITEIQKEWGQLRRPLFEVLSKKILDLNVPLTGTPSLDYETMGLHYYAPRRMFSDERDYFPPHMDGGTLTVLARANGQSDGLEVADLESTEKDDSEGIGLDASFLPVPVAADEVVVLLGTRMQRLLGKHTARACVHRVRAPTQLNGQALAKERFSIAIFCAPPVIQAR